MANVACKPGHRSSTGFRSSHQWPVPALGRQSSHRALNPATWGATLATLGDAPVGGCASEHAALSVQPNLPPHVKFRAHRIMSAVSRCHHLQTISVSIKNLFTTMAASYLT